MMVKTSDLIGPNDLQVEDWVIIELPTESRKPDEVDLHIFGWSPTTKLWQLSSKILVDLESHIETRSRKYFKIGPQATRVSLDGLSQLAYFLQAWRIDTETIEHVIGGFY